MLVLSRNVGQKIIIDGGNIEVSIIGVVGKQVKLAIKAPKYMTVDREEIHLKRIADKT